MHVQQYYFINVYFMYIEIYRIWEKVINEIPSESECYGSWNKLLPHDNKKKNDF